MPFTNPLIVSGADSGYFELLQGCVRSIRDKPESRSIALGILDVGLKDEERRWLVLVSECRAGTFDGWWERIDLRSLANE